MAIELNLPGTNQKKMRERVTRVELEVAALCPQTKDLQAQMQELTKRVGFLEYRAEDAEGQARRNNLRIIGLPGENGRTRPGVVPRRVD